jgi:hypothetical protein
LDMKLQNHADRNVCATGARAADLKVIATEPFGLG